MNEYNVGDLVEAVKGESVARGRIERRGILGLPAIVEHEWMLSDYFDEGWTVTVIETAAPALPTEPGHYLDNEGDAWKLSGGRWRYDGATWHNEEAKRSAPFTRLEPVPVTVERIAAWLDENLTSTHGVDIRAHFGQLP